MAVVFAVTCCQMCHHAGGEKRLHPSQCLKKKKKVERQEGKTLCDERWKFTIYHFIQVLLKLVLSLYMSEVFWYKSRSLRSTEWMCE